MTCIVGIKDGNNVYIGGDSVGSNGHTSALVTASKVFPVYTEDQVKMIIGYTTSFRMGQILECHLRPPRLGKEDIRKYLITKFIPHIIKVMEDNKFIKNKDSNAEIGTFMIGIRDRLFIVQDDLSVLEHYTAYEAIGSGAETAKGALYALKSLDDSYTTSSGSPNNMIKLAIAAAENHIATVSGPVKIYTT